MESKCTACLEPIDYGDLTDVSEEKYVSFILYKLQRMGEMSSIVHCKHGISVFRGSDTDFDDDSDFFEKCLTGLCKRKKYRKKAMNSKQSKSRERNRSTTHNSKKIKASQGKNTEEMSRLFSGFSSKFSKPSLSKGSKGIVSTSSKKSFFARTKSKAKKFFKSTSNSKKGYMPLSKSGSPGLKKVKTFPSNPKQKENSTKSMPHKKSKAAKQQLKISNSSEGLKDQYQYQLLNQHSDSDSNDSEDDAIDA
jgi:hypothetical protein